MKALTLEHLAPYLPYKLKLIDHHWNKCNISHLSTKRIAFIDINGYGYVQKLSWEYASGKIKLILHDLSDLTKEIEVNGEKFVPVKKLAIWLKDEEPESFTTFYNAEGWLRIALNDNILNLPYKIILKLLEWHFDIFGLIKNNLAIDKNTL